MQSKNEIINKPLKQDRDICWCPFCGVHLEMHIDKNKMKQIAKCPKCFTHFEFNWQGAPWYEIKVISDTMYKAKLYSAKQQEYYEKQERKIKDETLS